MDKLIRKIEIPLAKKAIERAGLYIVGKKDLDRLGDVAVDAYKDYPLHNWFTKGKYDEKLSKEFFEYFCRINGVDENEIPENEGALLRK